MYKFPPRISASLMYKQDRSKHEILELYAGRAERDTFVLGRVAAAFVALQMSATLGVVPIQFAIIFFFSFI